MERLRCDSREPRSARTSGGGNRLAGVPELPETETIARDLDRAVSGARIVGASVPRPDVLRQTTETGLKSAVTGAHIVRCWRRAKAIVLDLSNAHRLVVVPKFTGALRVVSGDLPPDERAYSAVQLRLSDGRTLHYRDVRRLGTVALLDPPAFERFDRSLGPEPLDPSFTPSQLSGLLRGSMQAVKKALMDQRRLAGVGNIYANEALWRAKVDPSRSASSLRPAEVRRLHRELTAVLKEAVAARGTSFRDYRDVSGRRGGFAASLQAYGRGGEPCPRCGHRLVLTHAVDGRATVFCATCQR